MTSPATAQTDAERLAALEAKFEALFGYFEALSARTGIPGPSGLTGIGVNVVPPPRRPNPAGLRLASGGAS